MQLLQHLFIIRQFFIGKKAKNDVKTDIEKCDVDDDT